MYTGGEQPPVLLWEYVMPRRMSLVSRDRIAALVQARPKAVGPRLGYLSMKYGIPARAFADLLHVSEPTVYRWFYGESEPTPSTLVNIRRLLAVFRVAAAAGDLPLPGSHGERMLAVRDVILKHKPKPVQ